MESGKLHSTETATLGFLQKLQRTCNGILDDFIGGNYSVISACRLQQGFGMVAIARAEVLDQASEKAPPSSLFITQPPGAEGRQNRARLR